MKFGKQVYNPTELYGDSTSPNKKEATNVSEKKLFN